MCTNLNEMRLRILHITREDRVLFLLLLEIFHREWRWQISYISARATFYAPLSQSISRE